MPRSSRIEYEGAFYLIAAHGHEDKTICADEKDGQNFLDTLAETCAKTGWRVHAWALLKMHYLLVVETPEGNLASGMTWFQHAFVRRFHARHPGSDRVFGDRYKSVPVEATDPHYYKTLLDYVHLEPVRAKVIKPKSKQSVADYPWSSVAGGYALAPSKRPAWFAGAKGLEMFELADSVPGRRKMIERLDERAAAEKTAECGLPEASADGRQSKLGRGWYWGSEKFAQRISALKKKPKSRKQPTSSSLDTRGLGMERVHELLDRGLDLAGLKKEELKGLGTDIRKIAVAVYLRRHSTISNRWMARQLSLKSPGLVSQYVGLFDLEKQQKSLPKRLVAALKNGTQA